MTSSFQRVILLHGMGSGGAALRPIAEALGLPQPVACPDGPDPFDMGPGRQWFSVRGVTEENRAGRIAEAMPAFIDLVEGLGDPRHSVLIGFSQGAIMALHAVAAGLPVMGVVAMSGRLAGQVAPRRDWPPITLLHGTDDAVMPLAVAHATRGWLTDAWAVPSLTVFDGLGRTIDGRVLGAVRNALSVMDRAAAAPL